MPMNEPNFALSHLPTLLYNLIEDACINDVARVVSVEINFHLFSCLP